MSSFQVLAILFAFFMIYVVNIHRRKAELSKIEVSFWLTMWSIFVFVAMFPNILIGLAGVLSFSRVFDLLVVVALMIITWLVFHSYLIQKESRQKIDEIVRKQAIRNFESKNDKK